VLNIEGNPFEPSFMDLILKAKPHQATLVPDEAAQLTSDHGWDLEKHAEHLAPLIERLKEAGVRVSVFIDPAPIHAQRAAQLGVDAVELYTEVYARQFGGTMQASELLEPYRDTARVAADLGLLVNAGHDLNLANLGALHQYIPWLHEVSIGHALVADAIYLGLENTVRLYSRILQNPSNGG
jgi:pyridoxine 5-phosphate synthase